MAAEVPAEKEKTGEELFKKCTACHGVKAEKNALGKANVLQGQKAEDIEKSLTQYKTVGGRNITGMGKIMESQVSTITKPEIKTLAEYISTLK
jgi:cytochrome c553